MKLLFSQWTALALFAACSSASAQIVTGNELVRVEVRVASDQDRKDLKSTSADTITQHKSLTIALSGKPKSPETRTGKWTAYGHSAKGHDYSVLASGEFKVEFSAQGRQTIESKKITTTYTPEHATVTRSSNSRSRNRGGGGQSTTKAKKVAATGTRFAGYGVVIKDGGKVVAEIYDPAGLKAEIAK
jgi:hypothetical protein